MSFIFIKLARTVIPCNVLMATVCGQSSKCGVHTAFANKHIQAPDMWFILIGLPTHVGTIKRNHCGPKALFFPVQCVFSDIKQVFPSKKNLTNFGLSPLVPLDLAVCCPRTTARFFHPPSFFFISVAVPCTHKAAMSGFQNNHPRSYSGLQPEIRREMRLGDEGGG